MVPFKFFLFSALLARVKILSDLLFSPVDSQVQKDKENFLHASLQRTAASFPPQEAYCPRFAGFQASNRGECFRLLHLKYKRRRTQALLHGGLYLT